MTIVEKAAFLKGLTEGLGVEPDSRDGKLWGALNELLADMAHEIEDLQSSNLDFADTLDEIGDELEYLEELTCDLDMPEDYDDESCCGCCEECDEPCDYADEDEDDDDDEPEYDGVIYDVTCPACGEEISFDEETLSEGSIKCPSCGETLEFDIEESEKKDD